MNAYASNYLNNQIKTASQEQILVMLYDGAINFCRKARYALDAGDKVGRGEGISRAMAIINELNSTLDFEIGGEIATELDALYGFMTRELISANVNNDSKKIATVIGLLKELRETWVIAIEMNRKAQSEAVPVPSEDGVAGDDRQALFRAAL
jgi:flagellar protein FliS